MNDKTISDFGIWETLKLDTFEKLQDLQSALQSIGYPVRGHATRMLKMPALSLYSGLKEVNLVMCPVSELGFDSNCSYAQLCARAFELGLRLCPSAVGPQLLLHLVEKNIKLRNVHVAMESFSFGDSRAIFRLTNHYNGEQELDYDNGRLDYDDYGPRNTFLFVLP